jgi:hypothetical protein
LARPKNFKIKKEKSYVTNLFGHWNWTLGVREVVRRDIIWNKRSSERKEIKRMPVIQLIPGAFHLSLMNLFGFWTLEDLF